MKTHVGLAQASYCNGADYWNDNYSTWQTVTVGSLANCVTSVSGYAGVYDLSGNVGEWEDNCNGTGQSAFCHIRGGSYVWGSSFITCVDDPTSFGARNDLGILVGFRCCSG